MISAGWYNTANKNSPQRLSVRAFDHSHKEAMMNKSISGIYAIVNKVNGKKYVGSSKDIEVRWKKHINQLNRGIHGNSHLQSSWDKYGKDGFHFVVLEQCDKLDLLIFEQKYLDLRPEYNISFIAGKVEFTDEVKNKISIANKGHVMSDEAKSRMSASHKGRKFTEEHKKNMSAALVLRMSSRAEKDKLIERNKSRVWSDESKKKASQSQIGKTVSDEIKKKISNSLLGRIFSAETKEKLSKAQIGNKKAAGWKNALGYKHTEETKKRIANSLKNNKNARRKDDND